MEKDSISVVIPAYNIEGYIKRAIDSVLAQTHQPDEIIVVDDGSTDGTAEQIKRCAGRVKYIYQENAGPGAARNTGIKAATSEWLAFLDGDDEWLPDNLKLQLDLFQRNKDLVWSVGNFDRCLCNEDRTSAHLDPQGAKRLLGGKDYFDDYFDAFTANAAGHLNTLLVKRQVLEEVGLFLAGVPYAEDIDMWFRLAIRRPKVGYIPQPIAVYHMHRLGSLLHDTLAAKKLNVVCDVVERNLKLAEQYNRLEKFKLAAGFHLRGCIRASLFDDEMAPAVRNMLDRFKDFFPPSYKTVVSILTRFPHATAAGCRLISRVVRLLRLRRKLVRSPR